MLNIHNDRIKGNLIKIVWNVRKLTKIIKFKLISHLYSEGRKQHFWHNSTWLNLSIEMDKTVTPSLSH